MSRGAPALVLLGLSALGIGLVSLAVARTERGGPGPDRLVGTARADKLVSRGGNDVLIGRGKADRLIGGKGRDRLRGGPGPDLLKGGKGKDRLKGGKGEDRLLSGPGGGTISGGPGSDEFNEIDGEQVGGAGNDRILARDGTEDAINCGPGEDAAVVDRSEDGVFDCETVLEPMEPVPTQRGRTR